MDKFKDIDDCPVCNCKEFKLVFEKDSFKGKKCMECDLVYISPRLTLIQDVYKDDITSSPTKYYLQSQKYDAKTFNKRIQLIEKFKSNGNLLDIGCSIGTMLETARQRGWNISGIEPNPAAAVICHKKNITLIGDFLDSRCSVNYGSFYDVIYIGDVIEHVENPVEMIKHALKMLKSGGLLMIVTPDFDSYTARLFQIKPLEHILYFNSKSIRNLMINFNVKIELLTKTTRRRSIKALEHSTTFSNKPLMEKMLKVFTSAGLNTVTSYLISLFVKDEILVIIRKL